MPNGLGDNARTGMFSEELRRDRQAGRRRDRDRREHIGRVQAASAGCWRGGADKRDARFTEMLDAASIMLGVPGRDKAGVNGPERANEMKEETGLELKTRQVGSSYVGWGDVEGISGREDTRQDGQATDSQGRCSRAGEEKEQGSRSGGGKEVREGCGSGWGMGRDASMLARVGVDAAQPRLLDCARVLGRVEHARGEGGADGVGTARGAGAAKLRSSQRWTEKGRGSGRNNR
ncbi:hypothetical protein B0H14DRAFT_3778427 [Mycena olivaceomarginata]|nr:hypothetical protein B0H14DRAFT_3778427 [Mycena olivaceomarginata]